MSADLQIISLTVPWPANYGGVIDIYYRLKALKEIGVRTELHCFRYDREAAAELEQVCDTVFYYPRKKHLLSALRAEPYITASRDHALLTQRIKKCVVPVLMEGLHSMHLLYTNQLAADRSYIRIHNIEHRYYSLLSKAETHPLRKMYFHFASKKLRKLEKHCGAAGGLACISETETAYYQQLFGNKSFHLPAFHPYGSVSNLPGKGKFVLYHGNLSVAENHRAAMFLLRDVAVQADFPLVIAGKSPRSELVFEAARHPNAKIFANPDETEMEQLIREAHVHALPTFQDTGVKLKLLAALFRGRFVVTNRAMTAGTGLDTLCYTAETSTGFRNQIRELMDRDFSKTMTSQRELVLNQKFNNKANAAFLAVRMGIR